MSNVGRNVKYHMFMKLFSLYCCAVVGINIVNYFTARNTGSFKFLSVFCCQPLFLISWLTVRNLVYCNVEYNQD